MCACVHACVFACVRACVSDVIEYLADMVRHVSNRVLTGHSGYSVEDGLAGRDRLRCGRRPRVVAPRRAFARALSDGPAATCAVGICSPLTIAAASSHLAPPSLIPTPRAERRAVLAQSWRRCAAQPANVRLQRHYSEQPSSRLQCIKVSPLSTRTHARTHARTRARARARCLPPAGQAAQPHL